MKRTTLSLLTMALAWSVGAQCNVERNDTIECFSRPDSVVFVHGENTTELKVFGTEENPDYYYTFKRSQVGIADDVAQEGSSGINFSIPFVDSEKKSRQRQIHTYGIAGGWFLGFSRAIGAPDNMNISQGSSIEVGLDELLWYNVRPWRGRTSFSASFGIRWRNYRMTGGNRFVKEDERLVIQPYENGSDIKFSRLKLFSLTVPLLFHQEIGRHFELTLGPTVNFNVRGSMKTKWKFDGEERSYSDSNIHPTKVTVDFLAAFTYRSIGVYAKYSPCKVLDTNFGPDFNHLSFGITLGY